MSKGCKIVLICGIVLFVLMLCVVAGILGTAYLGWNAIMAELTPIQDSIVQLCDKKGSLTQEDFSKYFSTEYFDQNVDNANTYLNSVFPGSYNCQDFYTDNFFDMIKKGQSFSVKTDTLGTNGTYTFVIDNVPYIVTLKKEGSVWRVADWKSVGGATLEE